MVDQAQAEAWEKRWRSDVDRKLDGLVVASGKIDTLLERLERYEKTAVTLDRFRPTEMIAMGLAGIVLLTVITLILARVLGKA